MSETKSAIRLNHLTIKNYKKIDYLEIDFPKPLIKGDADILVFGSKNGGGKTSVLECCSLIMLAAVLGGRGMGYIPSIKLSNYIKSGENKAIIYGEIESKQGIFSVELNLNRHANSLTTKTIKGESYLFKEFNKEDLYDKWNNELKKIYSFSTEPLIILPLLHFNSYRKIQESNPALGMISSNESPNYVSLFKKEVINALMGKAGLFENTHQEDFEKILSKVNELCHKYCDGEINQLQTLPDNTIAIRIKPKNGFSFHFDGLSSGQKEMIATLFLIWKNTKDQPSIVLIDEPELHLNAEWHSDFVWQLHQLAPQNQYILATHSKEIFRSVDKGYRAILESDEKGIE
jgi:predicted ATP-dependent endonuclease of OLD family